MDYTKTTLWMNSLANEDCENEELRKKLISEYYKIRENAVYILDKIRKDFPSLTVHDITHVDGLWQVASVIVGNKYPINPMEAFVLGCAFVMHDAVLSYDAAGGVELLRNRAEWKDYYEDFKEKDNLTEEEKLYETDFKTIRLLHAKFARQLDTQLFTKEDGSKFYIISNEIIRRHYGDVICKIAASHHWSIEELGNIENQFPVTSEYPQEWRINPLKLACILRCADAGHIDSGRAPDYLYAILDANGVSRDHWKAQNALSQIDIDINRPDKALIKSNIEFKEEDFAAWNVAYDAVMVFNKELAQCNELLREKNIEEFQVKGVTGAESREHLGMHIRTAGWKPCDAAIHIGNVEKLITNLGGEKLYGKKNKIEIVVRELIQNSRDAICARRILEPKFVGSIHIEIKTEKEGVWLIVSDDGIGMSERTVKNSLLNFGNSFWASDMAKSEFPGLYSSEFKSIGQFGIGFFSVFMIGTKVQVKTRRYDRALDETVLMKFPSGFCLRPILSQIKGESNVSTSVSILIDENVEKWNEKYTINSGVQDVEPFEVPYASVIANISAGVNVDVFYKENGKKEKRVHKNIDDIKIGSKDLAEWLKDITYSAYRENNAYSEYIDANYKRLKPLTIDGYFHGIAALNTMWNSKRTFFNVETVGGLASINVSSGNDDYIGFISSNATTAKREGDFSAIDKTEWAHEQYDILCKQGLSDLDKLFLPYEVGKYGIDMTDCMKISIWANNNFIILDLKKMFEFFATNRYKLVIAISALGSHDRVENHLDYYKSAQVLDKDEYLFYPVKNTGFLRLIDNDMSFPSNIMYVIMTAGNNLGINISRKIEKTKLTSYLFGKCDAMILSFVEKMI